MTKTLAYEYSSESTQQELSNEYQHDRLKMVFTNVCVLVLWMKVASALEEVRDSLENVPCIYDTFDNNFEIKNDFKEYLKAATINCSLSLTTAYVQNQVRACEKVTSDLVKSGGFRQVLQFPPPLTTNES